MSEEECELLAEIKMVLLRISFIKSPCEKIQIEAVSKDPKLIQEITAPTPLVCKIAVEEFLSMQITEEIITTFIERTQLMFFPNRY